MSEKELMEKSLREAYRDIIQCEAELDRIRTIIKAAGSTQHDGYIAFLKIKDIALPKGEDDEE